MQQKITFDLKSCFCTSCIHFFQNPTSGIDICKTKITQYPKHLTQTMQHCLSMSVDLTWGTDGSSYLLHNPSAQLISGNKTKSDWTIQLKHQRRVMMISKNSLWWILKIKPVKWYQWKKVRNPIRIIELYVK